MNKVKKYIIIFFIIISVFSIPLTTNAATAGDNLLDDLGTGVDSFTTMGENGLSDWGIGTDILEAILAVAQILYFIGCAVVLGGTIWLGIKYGTSNAEDKAKTKTKLIFWIIVCVVIIGAPSIWKLVSNLFDF